MGAGLNTWLYQRVICISGFLARAGKAKPWGANQFGVGEFFTYAPVFLVRGEIVLGKGRIGIYYKTSFAGAAF